MTANQITFPERGNACAWRTAAVALIFTTQMLGCAALRPLDGLPARHMPDSLKAPSRSGKKTIDLSLLAQRRPIEHLVGAGDVLGIYIEGVLGSREDVPPVHFPENSDAAPSMGYPIPVRADGTISLPMLNQPLSVSGLTLRQVEERIHRAYTVDRLFLNGKSARILVGLQKPREFRVLVIRQEAGDSISGSDTLNLGKTKRGTGEVVSLPAYENDVMHALTSTNGLPGLDAENTIYIIRRRDSQRSTAPRIPLAPPMSPLGASPGQSRTAHGQTPVSSAVVNRAAIQQTAWNSANANYSTGPFQGTGQYASYRMRPVAQAPNPVAPGASNATPYNSATQWPQQNTPSVPITGHGNPVVNGPLPSQPYPPSYSSNGYGGHGHSVAPPPPVSSGNVYSPVPDPISGGSFPGSLPFDLNDYGVNSMTVENSRVTRIPVRLGPGERPQFREQDIILNDGDIVFIESRETEIFYTGGLLGGGQYTLPRDYDLDVLGAIAIAQGRNAGGGATSSEAGISALNQDVTISASKLIVLRTMPNGTQVSIKVDLYKALRNPAERIAVQPGDYLILQYTPVEAVGAWLERYVLRSAIFGIAAGQVSSGN